jgi:glycerol uptake facilitator-like aquaporin
MLGGYFVGEAFGTMTFVITILIMTDNRTKLVDEERKDLNGNVLAKP